MAEKLDSRNLYISFRVSRAARQAAQELGLSYGVVAKPHEINPNSNGQSRVGDNRVVARVSGFDSSQYSSFWQRTQSLINQDLAIQNSF